MTDPILTAARTDHRARIWVDPRDLRGYIAGLLDTDDEDEIIRGIERYAAEVSRLVERAEDASEDAADARRERGD